MWKLLYVIWVTHCALAIDVGPIKREEIMGESMKNDESLLTAGAANSAYLVSQTQRSGHFHIGSRLFFFLFRDPVIFHRVDCKPRRMATP
jgi:hypothetical protein